MDIFIQGSNSPSSSIATASVCRSTPHTKTSMPRMSFNSPNLQSRSTSDNQYSHEPGELNQQTYATGNMAKTSESHAGYIAVGATDGADLNFGVALTKAVGGIGQLKDDTMEDEPIGKKDGRDDGYDPITLKEKLVSERAKNRKLQVMLTDAVSTIEELRAKLIEIDDELLELRTFGPHAKASITKMTPGDIAHGQVINEIEGIPIKVVDAMPYREIMQKLARHNIEIPDKDFTIMKDNLSNCRNVKAKYISLIKAAESKGHVKSSPTKRSIASVSASREIITGDPRMPKRNRATYETVDRDANASYQKAINIKKIMKELEETALSRQANQKNDDDSTEYSTGGVPETKDDSGLYD